jgi:hypothetical protein
VRALADVDELDVLRTPPAPALPAAAVDRLPSGELGIPEFDEDPYWRLVAAFLVECRRAQTRRAYFTDLKAWCVARELHPLQARRHDVALWARQLAEQPQPSTGKVRAQRLGERLWTYLAGRGPDFMPAAWPGEEVVVAALGADVYAGWSLHSARARNNRARVTTAAARIVDTDPRYVTIVVEARPEDRRQYQLRAVRSAAADPLATAAGVQGQLTLVAAS